MIALLLTSLQWLRSKATVIGLIIVAVSIVLWRVATTLVTTGAQQERLKQMEQTVRNTAKEKDIDARIDRMSSGSVRDSMLNKWSKR